ncbi:type ISP restriction/modification enzyme [Helicobacter sp. MIT 14-3879]|uniref:type ISP restriction/modification enzyme n=1 Tax=Helicobacter sp. MIT 14-3879 TaxID=2040649 RepID=UPI00216221B9|nr:type ISP restriction/modification enzyme [Helicobacter sp. MIT 14-3879]
MSYGKKVYEIKLDSNDDFIDISNKFNELISDFFNVDYVLIKSRDELVEILSKQSFYFATKVRDFYNKHHQTPFYKFLNKTYSSFKNITNYQGLSIDDFCDILGQSIVYGLFVSHLQGSIKNSNDFMSLLPEGFEILKEFIHFSIPQFYLPYEVLNSLDIIKQTISLIDGETISKSLKSDLDSITIYLYEDFLKKYDDLRGSENRKEGGVFYTPEPIVNAIVSLLNDILKNKLDKKKEFLDSSVKVLDFATGTGSFLVKIFEVILNEDNLNLTNEAIKQKLKDIYGFEISFVPYIVAHLKLQNFLINKGFNDFSKVNKIQILLTNTLDLNTDRDNEVPMPLMLLEEEDKIARNVKHTDKLLVILGNPPYNAKSKNNLLEIRNILQVYKDGLNEVNINSINDDYVKFIRFAEWRLLENTNPNQDEKLPNISSVIKDVPKYGLMGFITNNSFIWGRTHRKMREHLYNSFDEIYIINLHGDNQKDPRDDENVFNIRVGVCISLFVKYPPSKVSLSHKVFYYSTLENNILRSSDKFNFLNKLSYDGLNSLKWKELELKEPFFWFIDREFENLEYEDFIPLVEDKAFKTKGQKEIKAIFENYNSGIKFRKDNLLVQVSYDKVKEMLQDMQNLEDNKILQKYHLKETSDWKLQLQKQYFINYNNNDIMKVAYRPFDIQFCYYPLEKINKIIPRGDSRKKFMQHFLNGDNLGLCFTKDYSGYYDAPFISDLPIDINYNGGQTYITPLYRYEKVENADYEEKGEEQFITKQVLNFSPFFKEYCKNHKILKSKTERQILAFIYANLYNPNYRIKYAEYLKIGFPKINFEVDSNIFDKLESIGQKLIDLHLMKNIPQDSSISLEIKENLVIKKLSFKERFKDNKLFLNDDLKIVGINERIYNYTIGGSKVLEKYLSYRSNYKCGYNEIDNIINICKVIKQTIILQDELRGILF